MGSTGQEYETKYYNLDAIISVGYRVNSRKEYAETEFEKYRVIQDRIFESDFDRFELPKLPFDEG